MDTILLSVQDSERQTQLMEALAGEYDVGRASLLAEEGDSLPQGDVLILDLVTLQDVGVDRIDRYRWQEPNVATPVLLLAPHSRLSTLDSAAWEHVDEVLGTPVQTAELWGRVKTLLRLRRSTKEVRAAHEHRSSKYKTLFDSSALAILLLDDREIFEANDRAGDLLGTSSADLVGRTLASLAPTHQPDGTSSGDAARALVRDTRRNGKQRTEWQFAPPSGDPFWAELTAKLFTYGGHERVQVAFRDITEHKEALRKLNEHRERLVTAQRIAGLGSWERDFEKETLHWSEQTRRIFGWGSEESVTIEKYMHAVHPDDRETVRRQQERLFEEGTLIDIEYRILRPDGEERILQEQGEVEFAEDGTLRKISGTVLDVTEQREREQELRMMSEALEQTREAVLITEGQPLNDPGPRIVYANSAFEEMTGYAEEEILGRSPRLLQGPETDRAVLDSLRESLETGRPWEGETVNYQKHGEPYIVRWTIAPVYDSEDTIEYWVSVQRDVTEEREQEEALRRQRNLLKQTQRLPGAWEVDVRTGETALSDEVYRIHELSPEADIGLEEGFQFYPPGARSQIRAALERCVNENESHDLELPIDTAEGNRRWVRVVGAPSEEEEGEVVTVAGAFQDVTDRKRAEEALKERESRLLGLANSIPGVVYQFYALPDGTYGNHFVSEHAKTVLGIPAHPDTFFERFAERIPDSHRDRFQRSIEEAVANEQPWQLEMPFEKPSGERIWLLGTSSPAQLNDKLIYNGVLLDITERKNAEQTLQEECDRFATLFHNLPTPVVHGDPGAEGQLRVRAVNDAFESVFGYDQDEVNGEDIQSLIVPEEEKASADSIRRRLMAGYPVDRTVRRKAADGLRDFRVQVTLREGESGPMEGYAIYTDITDERRRQQRQQQQQEALLSLTNNERVVEGNFDAAIRAITERAAEVLDVALTSVWLFDDEGHLCCEEYYDRRSGEHSSVSSLSVGIHSPYFGALSEYRVIEVSDVHRDPRTDGLSPEYFQSRNIKAVLDAALRSEGEVIGVVCHEHVGETREWSTDEVQFAGEVADIVHRALRNQEQAERRREMAFQRSLLKAQQEAILDGMLVADEMGQVVSYNDRFVELWEIPETRLQKGDVRAVFETCIDHVDQPEVFREQAAYLSDHPDERRRDEVGLADGRVFDWYSTPLDGPEGTHYGRLWSFRDITERRKSRRQLERYSEYTERLLNASDDVFFVIDEEWTLRRWNEQLTAVTGYSDAELEGKNALAFVPEEARERAATAVGEVFSAGRSQMELPLLTKDRDTIPYEFTANCVEHPDGDERLVGIGRDVSARKRREETLLTAKREAEEASRLKSAMLANMSHEIRTPLTSVIGFTEVLEHGLEGVMEDFAEKAHRSAQRLMKTLDSVLELSKLEAGVYELERELVRFDEVVEETVELLQQEGRKDDLTVATDLPDEPVEGRWNEGMLNRILENLLENAIKFTPEGGEVAVRLQTSEEAAVLEVEDTGIGIGDEAQTEIFEAFKQESRGLDREYEGSGLGLSIVDKLTSALDGEISVESEKGTGTCFTVVLPYHSEE